MAKPSITLRRGHMKLSPCKYDANEQRRTMLLPSLPHIPPPLLCSIRRKEVEVTLQLLTIQTTFDQCHLSVLDRGFILFYRPFWNPHVFTLFSPTALNKLVLLVFEALKSIAHVLQPFLILFVELLYTPTYRMMNPFSGVIKLLQRRVGFDFLVISQSPGVRVTAALMARYIRL